jgi:hypothetical protein
MSPAQSETAGLRSLRDFGTSLIAGSGYYPGKPALGAFAEGFQGAERSQRGSEQQAAATLAAQQQYSAGQQEQYLQRLKMALPLLQMQYGATIPNPLLSANTPAVPGTAGGAGTPTRSAPLTPFIAKNLPTGVTPAEDQMVRTVIGEAGGEPLTGQQGVAAVIKNRMAAGKQDAQSVIFAPNQFEPWNNPATRAKLEGIDPGSQQYQDVLNKAVRPVMSGDAQDPTGGATNFYSPTAQKALGRDTPTWAAGQTPSSVIGGHQFYKLPFGPGTQYAGPGAPPGGPAGSAAPSTAPDTTTPPAASPAPGEQSFEQFQAAHPMPVDPATYTVTPPGLAEAKAAQAAAAQQLSLARAGRGGDPNKSLSDYNTATQAVNKLQQDAQAKSLELRQAAEAKAVETQRQLYDAAMLRKQGDEKAAADRAHAIELAKLNADLTRQTNKDTVVNTTNQKGLETAQQEQHDTGNIVAQLDGFRALSDNVEQPKLWQNVSLPGMKATIAETLGSLGLPLSDTGAVQLLRSGINGLVSTLRQGMPMGSLSDTDLKFIERLGPTEWMDKDTRSAVVGYLKQAYQAKNRFSFDVQKEMSRGKSYGDALDAANQNRKPFVPAVPAELSAHWTDPDPNWAQQRLKWAQDNDIRPGTLYHLNNGAVMVAKSPPQQGQR